MNKVIMMGRLTRDPMIKEKVARYSIAVDRDYKREGEDNTDFFNCVVFSPNNVKFTEKFLHKGTKILIEGRLQSGSYTNKEGQKIYTTDIVVERQEFAESKKDSGQQNGGNSGQQNGGYNKSQGGQYNSSQNGGYNQNQGGQYNAPQNGGFNQNQGYMSPPYSDVPGESMPFK